MLVPIPVLTFAHVVVPCAAKELTTSSPGVVCPDWAAGVSNLIFAVFILNAV